MPKNVTIIGGGIAGVSISRLLSNAGIPNKILERGSQLCVGSTWHAAGLVTRYASSSKIKKIHVRSLELMNELHRNTEGGISFHTPGSIRIIEKGNKDRLLEAKQNLNMAMLYDNPYYKTELITPDEIKSLHPLIDTTNIEAGLYTPMDGDVDPTQLTNCLAKEAKKNGTKIIYNQQVIKICKEKKKFIVKTRDNEYISDIVINAAGLWSRKISNMIGLHQPSMVIEHQYVITENVPLTDPLPVLRDLKGSSYIRKEGKSFLIGPYEEDCQIKDWDEYSPPETWYDMDLFPDNLDRISNNLLHAMELVPTIGDVGIKTVINGPTIWTGDSLPRVGSTSIEGWYDFNALTYGIAQSLGLAEYLFGIIENGSQPFDAVNYFNPSRYGKWANDSYVREKIKETYSHNNHISYPFENRSAGKKEIDKYPLYTELEKDNAQFGPISNGISVPFIYENVPIDNLKLFYNFPWSEAVNKETSKVLNNVGLSYNYFSKLSVKGKDSQKFLDSISVSKLPKKEGNCKLAYFVSEEGRLVSEFTICPIGNYYYLVGNGGNSLYDEQWLKSKIGEDMDVIIENLTESIDILHIAGPNAENLLSSIDERIKKTKFMKMRKINRFGSSDIDINLFRVSFTGCLGYELHVNRSKSVELYKLLKEHKISKKMNLSLFGSMALNSLRIEKGYKTYVDMDYRHYLDAGIEPFIDKNKTLGKEEYNKITDGKIFTMFNIHTDNGWEWSVTGDTPIISNESNEIVGYITSSAKGAESQKTIGLGYIKKKNVNENNFSIISYGNKWRIEVI